MFSPSPINAEEGFIKKLGGFAVDEVSEDGMTTRYFHTKKEALDFADSTRYNFRLRETSLEDVFVERAGKR